MVAEGKKTHTLHNKHNCNTFWELRFTARDVADVPVSRAGAASGDLCCTQTASELQTVGVLSNEAATLKHSETKLHN